MFNVVYYQQIIDDVISPAYRAYHTLYTMNMLSCPMIFTDKYKFIPDINIPIFNTYYLRNHFLKYFVLINADDFKYFQIYRNRIPHQPIVVYNLSTSCLINDSSVIELPDDTNLISNIQDILK